jgi:hypothetical protein
MQVAVRHPPSLGCLVRSDASSAPVTGPRVAAGIGYFPDGLLQAVSEPACHGGGSASVVDPVHG